MNDTDRDVIEDLKNPMRFSIRDRSIDLSGFPVEVTEIDVCPSEGNVYVHWREVNSDTDRPNNQ